MAADKQDKDRAAADKAAQEEADPARAEAADRASGVPTDEERARMDAQRIPSTDGGPAPAEPTSAEDSAGLMSQ